jgi:hypothetical protein
MEDEILLSVLVCSLVFIVDNQIFNLIPPQTSGFSL